MNEPGATPRSVPAGRGADWISEGYGLFRQEPMIWLGIGVLMSIFLLASQTTSAMLGFAFLLLTPVLVGGIMLGCDAQVRGRPLQIESLWAGFGNGHAGPLITLGLLTLAGVLVATLCLIMAVGVTVGGTLLSGGGLESVQLSVTALVGALVALLLLIPLSMALWFAPVLVAVGGLKPVAALKASFAACLINVGSMLVNGLLTIVIAIVATIPLGLGWLVALPVIFASVYFSYRDIFATTPPAQPNPLEMPR